VAKTTLILWSAGASTWGYLPLTVQGVSDSTAARRNLEQHSNCIELQSSLLNVTLHLLLRAPLSTQTLPPPDCTICTGSYTFRWHGQRSRYNHWTVWGSNPDGGEIFRTPRDRPRGPPSLLYNGHRVCFPDVKLPRRGVKHPPTSSAVVKETVELYVYSPSEPS
jgi:hypothetical protein